MKGECSSCRFVTNVKEYPAEPMGKIPHESHFCDLCAGSLASVAYVYGGEDARICGVICHVGNAILKKLGR